MLAYRFVAVALITALSLIMCATRADASSERTAIVGAKVYRSADEAPIDDAVILIKGARIEKVGSRASTRIPAGYRIVDGSGRVATAGFWNSHVHLTTPVLLRAADTSDTALQQELERDFTRWGFTTVFDLASTTAVANEVARRVDTGRVKGPRVLSVGEPFYPRDATPIYARPFYEAFGLPSAEITSDLNAVERVREQVRAGADGIKLFTGSIVGEHDVVHMPAVSIAAISSAARALGKPVFAHPTDRTGLEVAVANGVNILAHSAAMMGPWSSDYARWLAGRRIALIPTLSLFEAQPHPSTPVSVAVQQTAALYRAGGRILFGTDAGFTEVFDTSAELRLLGDAIGWKGVLTALTTAPAAMFGEAGFRGKVAPGFLADIVLLGSDPADGVEKLADVSMVIKDGRTIFARKPAASRSLLRLGRRVARNPARRRGNRMMTQR
jgi:imidazolonepropionase-like amidohydrolase